MSKTVIELQNIKRNFQVGDETVHALRGVSFSINEGEFVTIMGTSGSGKSTLLNILGCLDTPTTGEYLLDGISVRTMSKSQRAVLRNRKIGFVFQNYNLLPKTTAIENVELPLMYNSSVSASERRSRAIEALKAVSLGDRLEHKSNQMSGGQIVGAVFFLLVVLAAMTSSISLMETVVSIVEERFHWKRIPSCLIVTGISFLIGLLSVFGYSIWSDFTIFHMQFLDFFDYISNNIMMPIVALMTCVLVGFVVKTTFVEDEIEKNTRFRAKGLYRVMIKFICPICMLLILFSALFLKL